jgi:hypothetical protein
MLYDGGSVTGLRERSPRAAADARAVAEVLLANAPREPAQGANVTD